VKLPLEIIEQTLVNSSSDGLVPEVKAGSIIEIISEI
jgi:hypothetical protein